MKQLPPICMYHRNCLDGSGAAAVVRALHPDAELLPMQYDGTPPPTVEGRLVYVVDFALPAAQMRALRAQAKELVWLDHHATSVPIREQVGFGTVDTCSCGAELAWRHCFAHREMPEVLRYIRDKDLWEWRLPDSRAIAAGLAKSWGGSRVDGLLGADLGEMARLGRVELARIQAAAREAAAAGTAIADPFGLTGRRALAVPCNRDQNDVAEHICAPIEQGGLGYDLAVLFYRKGKSAAKTGSAEVWIHSLRSTVVDCAAIAAARGGGGHPSSACFVAEQPIIPVRS